MNDGDYGWELVEQRASGWCTIARSFEPHTYEMYRAWMLAQRGGTVKRLRRVRQSDPQLVNSSSYDEPNEEGETAEMAYTDTARNAGSKFGKALFILAGSPSNPSVAAAYYAGQQFAKMVGYTDLDNGTAYQEGFVTGYCGGDTFLLDTPATPSATS